MCSATGLFRSSFRPKNLICFSVDELVLLVLPISFFWRVLIAFYRQQSCQPYTSSLHLCYSVHPAIVSLLDPDRQIMLSTLFSNILKGVRFDKLPAVLLKMSCLGLHALLTDWTFQKNVCVHLQGQVDPCWTGWPWRWKHNAAVGTT
jgi:hypothetical protein